MAVKNYNPANILVAWNGIPIEGFADGTFVVAERANDSFSKVVGSSGEGARAKSNDKSGSVTVTLMQTSASNDLLSAALALDENSGDAVGPLLITDLNGTTLIEAQTAWILRPPNNEFGREISNREWVFDTDSLGIFTGGADLIG